MIFTARRVTPFDDGEARFEAGRFGMVLFLVTLGMLFGASVVGYLAVRLAPGQPGPWRPEGTSGLPAGLWLSTFVLLVSSATMHWGIVGIRRGDGVRLCRGLLATTVLGFVFLALQLACWWQLLEENVRPTETLFGYTFFVMTGLHGLHIVGGLVPLLVTTVYARSGRYDAHAYRGPYYTAMYWHFLDAVWLVLFAVLGLGS